MLDFQEVYVKKRILEHENKAEKISACEMVCST